MRILYLAKLPERKRAYDMGHVKKMVQGYASPGTIIDFGFPEEFPGSQIVDLLGGQKKLNGLDHVMGAPAIIRKTVWAAENGYDAVVQSNTFDPGVDGGRLVVDIPVLGPLRTAVHIASILTDRIGFVVPLPSHVSLTWRLLRNLGMDGKITDIRAHGVYGADILERKDEILETTAGIVRDLARDGAEGVIPLGAALIPYMVDPADIEAAAGVPVFNVTAISIKFAETCVNLGIRQSPLTYPRADLTSADFV